ncbi:hypothetical protein DP939_15855 [Spongiactinospora rosea]|uniref:Uncharacterized protein n=1 Tax=Spongiactinospora rosea TaxID=2248750 RepID=A0A366LZN4_9ACTN|nr:hypothetical protein [Spongiactinospora rosea]RBQ19391.1 hypothetical protein DP939_15855 [Spongiactinospora rosea]
MGAADRRAEIGAPVLVLDGAGISSNAELVAGSGPGMRHVRIPSAEHAMLITVIRREPVRVERASLSRPLMG